MTLTAAAPPLLRESPTAGEDPQLFAYRRVAAALAAVRRACPTLPVLAIQWMHPKHPVHPAQEALMAASGAACQPAARRQWRQACGLRGVLELVARLGVCIAHAAGLSLRLAAVRWRLRRALAQVRAQSFQVIAKTWCFGPEAPPDGSDFYFTDLPRRLASKGIRMLLLCGNVRDTPWLAFADGQTVTEGLCRLPEVALVPPSAPWRVLGRQLAAVSHLAGLAARAADPMFRRTAWLALGGCLSRTTMQNSLLYWVGRESVRQWRPRAFLTLYEGHGWEKCAWWGVRDADRSCQIAGYQHTIIFPDSLALLDPQPEAVGPRLLPDVVLSLGQVPCELIRERHEALGARPVVFGSLRHQERMAEAPADPSARTILVAPEGIPSETIALFTFAIRCARQMPQHTFIFRTHPEIPMPRALELLGQDLSQDRNIDLSQGRPLDEDMRRASVILYRGSSLIFDGILQGRLPLYAHVPHLVDTDPLYPLAAWHLRCATPEDVVRALAAHEQASPEQRREQWQPAVAFVRSYVQAVDEPRLSAAAEAWR